MKDNYDKIRDWIEDTIDKLEELNRLRPKYYFKENLEEAGFKDLEDNVSFELGWDVFDYISATIKMHLYDEDVYIHTASGVSLFDWEFELNNHRKQVLDTTMKEICEEQTARWINY